jgi:tetratricopeptide (TPR) repeat protein
MLDQSTDANQKTPENPSESNDQTGLNDQAKPNDQTGPNDQAESSDQTGLNDQAESSEQAELSKQAEPIGQDETATQGFWANLSNERKRGVKIGALALALIIVAVIVFTRHPSPESSTNNAPGTPAQTAEQAVSSAEQVALRAPTPENFVNLSAAYYNAKRYGDCITVARKAIALKPDFPEAYNNVAAGFLRLSVWDSAIAAANEAIRLKPDFQLAKNNLAGAIDGKKGLEERISKLSLAASTHPTPENYLELSAAYFQASQFDNCIAACRKSIALRPTFAAAYNNICVAYNQLGRFADAKKAGEEAVRLDSNNQLAKNNLKWSIQELNKKQ